MTTRHTQFVRRLAEIDQLIAFAYEVGDDPSLTMHELFTVCDSIESLEQSRQDVEAELAGKC